MSPEKEPGTVFRNKTLEKAVREERRLAFQEFVSTVSRRSSPSLLQRHQIQPLNSPQSMEDTSFNWSIDQIAALRPVEFSREINESFYRLDESTESSLRRECEEFFNQSRVLPSPDAYDADANDGFGNIFSPRNGSVSAGWDDDTPSRGFGDMSVSESKLPTPVNVSKTRQRKKKLFFDEIGYNSAGSEMMTQFSETVSSCNNTGSNCQVFQDSITGQRLLEHSLPTLSPIAGDSSRVVEMGEADDTFSRESAESYVEMMETSVSHATNDPNDLTSAKEFPAAFHAIRSFPFKTSTPSWLSYENICKHFLSNLLDYDVTPTDKHKTRNSCEFDSLTPYLLSQLFLFFHYLIKYKSNRLLWTTIRVKRRLCVWVTVRSSDR